MKRRLLRGLWLVVAGLAPFVAVEVGLRVAGYHPPRDPYLAGFSGEPIFARDGDTVAPSPQHLMTWRAEPFPATPEPGALRIFSVGDSIAWGHRGNEFADPLKAYAEVLQELLRERLPGGAHRVVNCGARTFATTRVAGVVREVLDQAPDVVLLYVGTSEHLETLLRQEYEAQRGRWPRWFWELRLVGWLRAALRPASTGLSLAQLRLRDDALRAGFVDARSTLADDAERRGLLETAERDLNAIADACEARGVPLVLATVPSDLRFPPFATRFDGGAAAQTEGEALIARAGALLADGKAAQAEALLRPAVAAHPEAAGLHFRLAQAREQQGDVREARESYRAARDRDACPARATGGYNDLVRRIARERASVHLADVEALFEAAVPDHIPDVRLFLDNCHPRPAAHALIAEELYRVLEAAGLLRPHRAPAPAPDPGPAAEPPRSEP